MINFSDEETKEKQNERNDKVKKKKRRRRYKSQQLNMIKTFKELKLSSSSSQSPTDEEKEPSHKSYAADVSSISMTGNNVDERIKKLVKKRGNKPFKNPFNLYKMKDASTLNKVNYLKTIKDAERIIQDAPDEEGPDKAGKRSVKSGRKKSTPGKHTHRLTIKERNRRFLKIRRSNSLPNLPLNEAINTKPKSIKSFKIKPMTELESEVVAPLNPVKFNQTTDKTVLNETILPSKVNELSPTIKKDIYNDQELNQVQDGTLPVQLFVEKNQETEEKEIQEISKQSQDMLHLPNISGHVKDRSFSIKSLKENSKESKVKHKINPDKKDNKKF